MSKYPNVVGKDMVMVGIGGVVNVYGMRSNKKKPTLLHTMEKKTKKLKKKVTLKPAYEHTMKRSDEIFFEQADRRIKKAMSRVLFG